MKILSLILAIYFFDLSVKTCADSAMAVDNCQTVSCVHLEAGHADHHTADSCSPLCTCSCCGGVTLVYESSPDFKADFTLLHKPLYSENPISEISYSIWQPPKI